MIFPVCCVPSELKCLICAAYDTIGPGDGALEAGDVTSSARSPAASHSEMGRMEERDGEHSMG